MTDSSSAQLTKAPQRAAGAPSSEQLEEAAELATAIQPFLRRPGYATFFEVWQRLGVHVVPAKQHSPIPDTRKLSPDLWRKPREAVGLDMNESLQMYFMTEVFPRFRSEYESFGTGKSAGKVPLDKGAFAGTDALVLYCMVRHFEPRTIIAVGVGDARTAISEAARINGTTEVHAVEPGENGSSTRRSGDGIQVTHARPQDLPLEFFTQLGPGDILFVDSSHTVTVGGDVNFLLLDVLPRLRPGVVVHFHDIFLPMEMPWGWVSRDKLFWNEQYLLRAFLSFNPEFEVVFGNSFMGSVHQEEFKRAFPSSPWWGGGSFWIRRALGHETAG